MKNDTLIRKNLRVSSIVALIFPTFTLGYSTQHLPQCKELADKPVTITGKRVSIEEDFRPDTNTTDIPANPNARYLRVRFKLDAADGCNWYLTIRDDRYRVIQTFSPRTIRNPDNQWTVRVPGAIARFELERCGKNSPAIRFKEYIWMPAEEEVTYYSVQDPRKKQFFPLYKSLERVVPTAARPLGDFVGFMMSSWGRTTWTCSGVLIAPDLFLTNWHCGAPPEMASDDGYWSEQIIKDTIIDFSWDDDELSREYAATECVASNKGLDFAILRIKPIDLAEEGPRSAIVSSRPAKNGDPIWLIHHPAAMQKHISQCEVVDPDYPDQTASFTHRCDTEAGSSGAPVFDSENNVVGLHNHGFTVEVINNRCRYTDAVNKAVRMDKILEHLSINNNSVYQRLRVIK